MLLHSLCNCIFSWNVMLYQLDFAILVTTVKSPGKILILPPHSMWFQWDSQHQEPPPGHWSQIQSITGFHSSDHRDWPRNGLLTHARTASCPGSLGKDSFLFLSRSQSRNKVSQEPSASWPPFSWPIVEENETHTGEKQTEARDGDGLPTSLKPLALPGFWNHWILFCA